MKKTSEERIQEVLLPLVKELKRVIYLPEYQSEVSDAEVLGVIVSKFCKWDINEIIEVAKNAFEDSNFREGTEMMEKLQGEEVEL